MISALRCIGFFSILGMSLGSAAQSESSQRQAEMIVHKLSLVRERIHRTAQGGASCDTPKVTHCDFEKDCDQFTGKTSDAYLYKNEEGRTLPNYQLLDNLKAVEGCLNSPFLNPILADPLLFPIQLFDVDSAGGTAQLKKNQDQYKKEHSRVSGVFADVKERLIASFKKKQNAGNRAQMEALLAKIASVKLRKIPLKETGGDIYTDPDYRTCEMPNAVYWPQAMEIQICPQLLKLPDATLFSIIAHELAHSVDPCSATYSYVKNPQGERVLNVASMDPLEEQSAGGFQGKEVLLATPLTKNPFKEVISCLEKPKSIGAKVPGKKEILGWIENEKQGFRNEEPEDGKIRDAQESKFDLYKDFVSKNYEQLKYCDTFSGDKRMLESFADWVSADLVGEKVAGFQDSSKARRFAYESQAFFMAQGCKNIEQAVRSKLKNIVQDRCNSSEVSEALGSTGDYFELIRKHSTLHPATEKRVDRIYNANSRTRKALGCNSPKQLEECKF